MDKLTIRMNRLSQALLETDHNTIWQVSNSNPLVGEQTFAIVDAEGRDVTKAYGFGLALRPKRWASRDAAEDYLKWLRSLTPSENGRFQAPDTASFRIVQATWH